jgi:hypothetical protein
MQQSVCPTNSLLYTTRMLVEAIARLLLAKIPMNTPIETHDLE